MKDNNVANLHYREPALYEAGNPHSDFAQAKMVQMAISRYGPAPCREILDVGCGTGRDLAFLTGLGFQCHGVDIERAMIDYARRTYPGASYRTHDMRSVRLGRRFDAILCLGSTLTYALTNKDLSQLVQTFSVHSRPGTLLILGFRNAANMLADETTLDPRITEYNLNGFVGRSVAYYRLDHHRQQIIRRRSWFIDGHNYDDDYCSYRLIFPLEIEYFLANGGFHIVKKTDTLTLDDSDLSGWRMYIIARFCGTSSE
ncbi:class I SAM-dependent methyltransferase [Rhizobium ruizarguesonis]|uniref:class I SAM-dependent methyltransferase n=1 Tax=Rhizobium ruizarguesonis TaxID=2081791 RepID=UPI0013EE5ECE|nr:class I SAM-dependent methyltransferase [Rhizobium ruizarguesonis]MBY5856079.1 methyltransferase domain-containing protein [Rhizobium leguminosarum]